VTFSKVIDRKNWEIFEIFFWGEIKIINGTFLGGFNVKFDAFN